MYKIVICPSILILNNIYYKAPQLTNETIWASDILKFPSLFGYLGLFSIIIYFYLRVSTKVVLN